MDHIVGIYNGSIRYWNDSSISQLNPTAELPGERIRVIAREDDAGSTEIFTSTLSRFSPSWNATYGRFSEGVDDVTGEPVKWNSSVIDAYARTNRGMSGILLSYRYAIGYVSCADVVVSLLPYARVVTEDGQDPLDVSIDSYYAAMQRSVPHFDSRFNADLSDYVIEGEYPFIGYSYFIVDMFEVDNCDLAVELVRYIEWIGEDEFARDEVTDFKVAPVSEQISDLILNDVLKRMTCDGENLYALVETQKREELISTQKWRIPVYITFPVVFILLVVLIGYIVFQQVKLRRAIASDAWKIDAAKVELHWSHARGFVSKPHASAVSLALSTASQISANAPSNVVAVGVMDKRTVCYRQIKAQRVNFRDKQVRKTLIWFRDKLQHSNVLRFYGVAFLSDDLRCYVSDHARKGTLSDVIQNEKYRIDDNIKFSLAVDVAEGVGFLHSQGLLHSSLTPDCCYIDSKWSVRIGDWENHKLETLSRNSRKISRASVAPSSVDIDAEDENVWARRQFWIDPEIIRCDVTTFRKSHDVYSCGMILVEIFTRENPFDEYSLKMQPTQVLDAIRMTSLTPDVTLIEPRPVRAILLDCWRSDHAQRLSCKELSKSLKAAKPSKKG